MTTARIISRATVPAFVCNSYFRRDNLLQRSERLVILCCGFFFFEWCFGSVPLSQNWFEWPAPRSRRLYPLVPSARYYVVYASRSWERLYSTLFNRGRNAALFDNKEARNAHSSHYSPRGHLLSSILCGITRSTTIGEGAHSAHRSRCLFCATDSCSHNTL
jgi:hypothetical protein